MSMAMTRDELFEKAKKLALTRIHEGMKLDQKIDQLELAMTELLDVQIMKPALGRIGTLGSGGFERPGPGRWLMGDDPRLPKMPEQPGLADFFRYRFLLDNLGGNHLLQSAKLAMDKGLDEKIVLACLLHDISVVALVRNDHGHWAAQMIEPYVDPEITWAVRHHQALRFRPDPALGYEYPANYLAAFGEDYAPPDYIKAEWEYCADHKWYNSAMQVVINDLYSFDPEIHVPFELFEGIIMRNFRNPAEGLGFDRSPVAHMWRSVIWPNNFL